MVDAAGAVYVIGGTGDGYGLDVWVSTDGGARAGRGRGGGQWGTQGGTTGVLAGYSRGF